MEQFRRLRSILTGATTLLVVSACSAATKESGVKAASGQAAPASESIGAATQEADGTIVLMLRATADGTVGDAQFRYPPTHAQYAMIKAHVGPIASGKSVLVRPFPER